MPTIEDLERIWSMEMALGINNSEYAVRGSHRVKSIPSYLIESRTPIKAKKKNHHRKTRKKN